MTTPPFHHQLRKLSALLVVAALVIGRGAAATLSEWQQRQSFEVPAPGLVALKLPPATLDALRPGLEDLLVVDADGREQPFLIQRPAPEPAPVRAPKSFKPILRGAMTVLEIETGLDAPLNAVTLETPERGFIKSVRVEGSRDGQRFTVLADGVPIFRQGAASELSVRFPAAAWPRLRVTIDDQRSGPLAFTGARIHAANDIEAATESMTLAVKSREEIDGDTRLVIDLGAANLTLASIELDTPETLFQREIISRVSSVVDEEIREVELRRGFFYALDATDVTRPRKTSLAIEQQIRARELILLIRNFDSPPLAITGVRATRRPVRVLFHSRDARTHALYAGNQQCAAPRYDLGALGGQLKTATTIEARVGSLMPNPDYRVAEALPGLAETGATLDTAPWSCRKRVTLTRPGAQQLELDLEVLSHARPDLGDLRLVRDGRQVPYLIERTSITRGFSPTVESVNDAAKPHLSRWKLTLPHRQLPVARLECLSRTTLFQRQVRVWEEVPDGRGGKYRRELGQADWQRTDGGKETTLVIHFSSAPATETLVLETDNGDNPALELDRFRLTYPVTRLVFKAGEPPDLYYGGNAVAPRYDLSLIATRLLAADKANAMLGPQEILKGGSRTSTSSLSGIRSWLFWGVLALVTVGLVFIVIRLLPAPPTESKPPDDR